MLLDIHYVWIHIANPMHLEIPKRYIICNRGSNNDGHQTTRQIFQDINNKNYIYQTTHGFSKIEIANNIYLLPLS